MKQVAWWSIDSCDSTVTSSNSLRHHKIQFWSPTHIPEAHLKQILQNLKNGATEIVSVPVPRASAGGLLIQSLNSLVSAGTERMLVDFGKANLLNKALQQPDKVRMVLDKVRTDGIAPTLDAVTSKLDQPIPLGYCNVGVVCDVGSDVRGFSQGDRVISNGHHAEYVAVAQNLCALVPDSVSDESAAFTVLGAIGLQGIRLANPTIGECVIVTGLGLVGLLTVQLLRAQGCRVLGIDFDPGRLALAKSFGAEVVDLSRGEDPLAVSAAFSRGRGVDAVLITASTKSNEPMSQAAKMCRKRGRIVLVGVAGLELSRADFFEKELTFQVSCSYGPGRYDSAYEDRGHDYPVGYVRWTEQRNFEAILDLMAAGHLDVEPLISHRFKLERAVEAYDLLSSGDSSMGILVEYDGHAPDSTVVNSQRTVELTAATPGAPGSRVGAIGAGNYAGRVLLPAFSKAGARLSTVVSGGGVSGVHYGKKYGFENAATDAETVFNDNDISTVVIATRHDTHADYVVRSLQAGKHVFVEKPLCLTRDELDQIISAKEAHPELTLMVGFNRRFSPLVMKISELLKSVSGPKSFIFTINAGEIPAEHWTQDLAVGGGRIVGEACHFIDLVRHLAGSPIDSHAVVSINGAAGRMVTSDKASISLKFADGSFGVVHYLANGHKAFPKERLEVFCGGKILQLDNFRRLNGWGWKGFSGMRLWRQDKGQESCVSAFMSAVNSNASSPIPFDEIVEVSRASIDVQEALS